MKKNMKLETNNFACSAVKVNVFKSKFSEFIQFYINDCTNLQSLLKSINYYLSTVFIHVLIFCF